MGTVRVFMAKRCNCLPAKSYTLAVPSVKSYPTIILVKVMTGLGKASILNFGFSGLLLSLSFTTQKSEPPMFAALSLDFSPLEVPASK